MPNLNSLRTDVLALRAEAEERAQVGIVQVVGDATKVSPNSLDNPRLAFPILAAIEETGRILIVEMQIPSRGVIAKPGTDLRGAKEVLDEAMDGYMDASSTWGRQSAASPQGRNQLLDRDRLALRRRLLARLDIEARNTANQSKPKPWWERYQAISLAALVISLASFLHSCLSKAGS